MLLLGVTLVTATDLMSKSIIPLISIWQILLLRSLVGLIFLLMTLVALKKIHSIKAINLNSCLFSLFINECLLSLLLPCLS